LSGLTSWGHKKSSGFFNSHLETLEGLKVLLDLWDWELDEHTGDLWSLILAGNHLDVVEDEVTDLFLHVWVSLLDGWHDAKSLLLVLLLWGELLGWLSTWHHWLLLLLHHAWLLWHSLGLWHSWLLLHHTLVHGLWHTWVSTLVETWFLVVTSSLTSLVSTLVHLSSVSIWLLVSHVSSLWLLLDELE